MVEEIGKYSQQIKPVFDIDAYEIEPDINKVKEDINKIFPNKIIHFAKREPREFKNKGVKYSYRAYVDGVRITSKNLKNLCLKYGLNNNHIYDLSIYDKNKVLLLPYTTKKENLTVPALIPVDCDIFSCCASYIKKDFEDWDIIAGVVEPKTELINNNNNNNDNNDNNDDNNDNENKGKITFLNLQKILKRLKEERSADYNSWFAVICCIKNICCKSGIDEKQQYNLIHTFSQLSKKYDFNEVEKFIMNSYEKLNENKGYGWKYLINDCLKVDDIEYYEKFYLKSYQEEKIIFEKTYFKCKNPIGFIEINNNINELDNEILRVLSQKEIQILFNNKYCLSYEYDKKSKTHKNIKTEFINKWLKDENIKTYDKLIFTPQHLTEKYNEYYNLFNGFKAELLPIYKDYEAIKPILNHIKEVLCNNNDDYYNWLIQYYANIIQKPLNKTETIIIYKGNQGCGKNIIIDFIAKKIIGDDYSILTANPERHILGTFNSCLLNKVFAVCNEVGHEMRSCMDKLKDLSTAPDITIEKKGKEPIKNPNYININMTTNNNNPLDIANDDRRICWLNCSNKYIGNVEYFNILLDCVNDDKIISSFYHYLKEEVKITISNFQKSRPITKEYQALKRLNTPNYIKFLIDVEDNNDFDYRKYKGEQTAIYKVSGLYNNYKLWCENSKFSPYNKSQFEERLLNEETGIIKCVYEGNKCYRINKNKFIDYINKHKGNNEELEEIQNNNFEDDE